MKREDFYYDSRDGIHKIHAVRWSPDDGEIGCILQLVHGMAEHVERYEHVAEYFTKKGMLVVANDHLGHGKSVKDKSEYGYFCKNDPLTVVVRDVHRLKKITQEENPGKPCFIMGHSMGSLFLRNYLFRYGSGIDGAIIQGTTDLTPLATKSGLALLKILSFFEGEKKRSAFANGFVSSDPNARIKDPRTPSDWLCDNEEVVDRFIADEACGFTFTLNGLTTIMHSVDNLSKKKYLAKVPLSLPLLIISGDMDPIGAYGENVKRAYERYVKLGMKDVTMKLYPGLRHEIHNERNNAEVFGDIYAFIDRVCKEGSTK